MRVPCFRKPPYRVWDAGGLIRRVLLGLVLTASGSLFGAFGMLELTGF